jgi:hypothetical protein
MSYAVRRRTSVPEDSGVCAVTPTVPLPEPEIKTVGLQCP